MANEIEVCNVALSRVGANSIQSLNDATREARVCKTHYEIARDATLRDHDWQFARREVVLALLVETSEEYDYVYQYPSDCVAARRIVNAASNDPVDRIPFGVGANAAKNGKVILTDQEDAVLVYTAKITNATVWDSQFVDAMAWRLASELAVPLNADSPMAVNLMRQYLAAINAAKADGSNEQAVAPINSSSFSTARA